MPAASRGRAGRHGGRTRDGANLVGVDLELDAGDVTQLGGADQDLVGVVGTQRLQRLGRVPDGDSGDGVRTPASTSSAAEARSTSSGRI